MATTTAPPPVAASSTDAFTPPVLPADAVAAPGACTTTPAAGDPAAADDFSADEASEAEPPPPQIETPFSDEEILNNLLKECELLTNENAILSDYILRVAASKVTNLSDISEEATDSEDDEIFEYASRSSVAQSLMGRGGSILEGAASRRGSSAGFPGLKPLTPVKSEIPEPEVNLQALCPTLNAEEKNEIAMRGCLAMKEEIESSISENERMLDELRAAFDEASLRIGELRRDRADFQRDVLADARAKGVKRGNADKILK